MERESLGAFPEPEAETGVVGATQVLALYHSGPSTARDGFFVFRKGETPDCLTGESANVAIRQSGVRLCDEEAPCNSEKANASPPRFSLQSQK